MTDLQAWLLVVLGTALLIESWLLVHYISRVDRSMGTITQWDHFACGLIRTIQNIEGYDKQKVVTNAKSTLRWLRNLEPEERAFD